MTDDLEPRLTEHLRQRANRVGAPADLDDVHRRIATRERRTTRALGAALVVALVAGPLLGWTLARSTEPDRDTLTAGGGAISEGGAASGGDEGASSNTGVLQSGFNSLDDLELVAERTTEEGIALVVRSTGLGAPDTEPCAVDGIVRVGVVDAQLVDVAYLTTAPGGSSFGVVGGADGRPMWVVVARATAAVEAEFPNGTIDRTEPAKGVAVLAAYADAGQETGGMTDDVVLVTGLPGRAVEEGPREVTLDDGNGGCTGGGAPTVGPPVDLTMPEPGEPPADEATARAEIEELFSGFGGRDPEIEVQRHERPNVWRDADRRFREEHPEYLAWAKEVNSVPLEIVFTAPDRATVRYELVSDNPSVPAPGERLGEAVLIDGEWKVSIETTCGNLGLAGIECDYSIEG